MAKNLLEKVDISTFDNETADDIAIDFDILMFNGSKYKYDDELHYFFGIDRLDLESYFSRHTSQAQFCKLRNSQTEAFLKYNIETGEFRKVKRIKNGERSF